ncbi:MAG: tRNA pseudouridine(55) synthase TruB [Synergistaceae bacterium]|nr:tRNA pseudouridine(55) synthase TruB [Synergistaceae bacterium]
MLLTGFLPLNKPVGMRSTRCVEMVRSILGRKIKVGHGGTLDSTASGLLVLLVGQCTRLSNFVMEMPKCYGTVVSLGSETSTDDASGEILCANEWRHVTESSIDTALCGFMGWRMQAPPKISAVHVDGERAHNLTRSGQDIELAEKPVYFAMVRRTGPISPNGEVPFMIRCRKGTYIRSFARDLGRALGCGAHVLQLERLSVGPFDITACRNAEELSGISSEELAGEILPLSSLCGTVPMYKADAAGGRRLSNGQGVSLSSLDRVCYGGFISASNSIIVTSEGIFSVCSAAAAGGTICLMPAVNIISDGGK